MIGSVLQHAIDNLKIQDVYLHQSQSKCAEGFRPQDEDFTDLHIQHMYAPKQSAVFELDNGEKLLRVSILLGIRWVIPSQEQSEPDVKVLIESEFIAEYVLVNNVSQEGIDEFAHKNAIYHVWPYWREYLSSQSDRLRLPRVTLPTFQLSHHKQQEQAAE